MCTLHAVVVLWVCLCVGCRFNEGEEVDEKGNAQLAELPEGLRAMAGEVQEHGVRSKRLAVVPGWVGELTHLTHLEALEVSSVDNEQGRNNLLKSLPASLGQLGALKQLTLAWLGGLEVLPDAVVRLSDTVLAGQLDDWILLQAHGAAEGNGQAGGAEGAHALRVV